VRVIVVLVLGTLAVLLVGRPLVHRVLAPPPRGKARPGQTLPELPQPKSIAELEGEIEKQLDYEAAIRAGDRKLPVLTKRIVGMAKADPENAARLVRSWLMDERR
jgi:flagellar biosynthesis/type III secretory pathway M-ring protein FliF/YscJ